MTTPNEINADNLDDAILSTLFGDPSTYVRKPKPGPDIQLQISLRYGEAFYGTEKVVKYMRREACSHCAGSGAASGGSHSECPRCEGRGRATAEQPNALVPILVSVPCPTCDGYGTVPSLACPACGGSRVDYKLHKLGMQIHEKLKAGRVTRFVYRGLGEASRTGGENGDLIVLVTVEPL